MEKKTSDLISRADAIDALCQVDEYNTRSISAIKKLPSAQPTIDAVEVVRCGECRHKYMKDFDMFCPHMVGILKPNMHCSYGEREGE